MSLPNSEIISAVYQLLPGFVTAWIFYGLSAYEKPAPFERVVQALIFTLFAEASSQLTGILLVGIGSYYSLGVWDSSTAFLWKVLFSIALGFVFAAVSNTNSLRDFIPDWLSKKTLYPSEWYSAFHRTKKYVYLHLVGERRLYGWAEEWPDSPTCGHFVIMKAEWILDDNTRIPLLATERLLIRATDVELVEFAKDEDELSELTGELSSLSEKMIDANRSKEDCDDRKASD